MADPIFPERPAPPLLAPTPVVRVVRREPLVAIEEVLAISIHDVVNDARFKWLVADFYRLTRAIENEAWLRRQFREQETKAWVAAHL